MVLSEIYIDAIWISVAFLCGLAAKQLKLPALIGFLMTGIILNMFGLTQGNISTVLNTLADLGVMLLLFTIGLKIKVKSLIQPQVWLSASIHMMLTILAIGSFAFLMGYLGLHHFAGISVATSMLIGFALSFSSTVFVVKILEERGELSSFHGSIAIGILVIQDIFAVLFLTFTNSETPSLWALALPLYLYLVRLLMNPILNASGRGELLTIFGFFATFVVGALSFNLVGLKPDLGALTAGMILVGHKRADELYTRMMSYKDFFLVAFFISIGLQGIPSLSMVLIACLLLIFILVKAGFFIYILSYFNLRARTAFLASMSLSNFSEFGLITLYMGAKAGLIHEDWLLITAVLMSFSFFISSPLNAKAHQLFDRFKNVITLLNRGKNAIDKETTDLGEAEYLIIGMGSIGYPAFAYFEKNHPGKVIGMDYSHERVQELKKEGFNVMWGDSTNSVFWEETNFDHIKIVMLAMSDFASNHNTLLEIMKLPKRPFKIGAISHYDDERLIFLKHKVDMVYDYKKSVGADYAEQVALSVS
jgi:glutathione-regulated potassium-efflux system ancillary protein KefC